MSASLRIPLIGLLMISAGCIGYGLGRLRSDAPMDGRATRVGTASAESLSGTTAVRSDKPAISTASEQYQDGVRVPWTRQRIADAGQAIIGSNNIFGSIRPMMRLADSLSLEDIPAAMEAAEDLKGLDGKEIFLIFTLLRWSELDPAGAAANAKGDSSSFFNPTQEVVIPSWAARDPFAALAWAKTLKDGDQRKKSLELIIQTVARRNVPEAMQMARAQAPELLDGQKMPEAIVEALKQKPAAEAARQFAAINDLEHLDDAVGRWAQSDRTAALAWTRGLQDPEMQRAAFNAVIAQWSKSDAKGAASALDVLVSDGSKLGQAAGAIARHWPENDLDALKARVTQWPEGQARTELAAELAQRLGNTDLINGANWVNSLPPGDAREKAVEYFAKSAASRSGGVGVEWAMAISNPERRTAAVSQVVRNWFRNNPAEAYEWLRNTTLLDEEQKQQALKSK